MRKAIASLFAVATMAVTYGQQLYLPELSPLGKIHQQVGYTTIEVTYGRPSTRERRIMGELVPYKKLWRTGAGPCTTISFDSDVTIGGKIIPKGIYALLTIPDEKEWIVMLNKDTSKVYGDPSEYDVNNEVVNFKVTPAKTNRFYESLTINLDIKKYDAMLYLSWENTEIHFPVFTGSHEKAIREIHRTLQKNPHDQESFAIGAYYYFMNNEDSHQILQWIDKGLALGEERWLYNQKIDVLERIKNYSEARATTTKAISFLQREKPYGWDYDISDYEERLKKWPAD